MPMRNGADAAIRYSQNLYITAYLLFVIKYMCDTSSIIPWPASIDNLVNIIFIVLLLVKLVVQRHTALRVLCLAAVFIMCLYSSVNAKYFSPFLSLMCILAIQDVDLRRVMRIGYRVKTVVIITHVICYGFLVAAGSDNLAFISREGATRHYFLLGHPNMLTAIVVWVCLEYIYVNYERLRLTHLAFIILINIVTYQFTGSRTGVYVLSVVSGLIIFVKLAPRLARAVIHPIAKYGFGVFSILSVVITTIYTPTLTGKARDIWIALNYMLTGRLVFGAYAYHDYGYTWLGRMLRIPQKVYYNGHWLDGVIFDNSYQWLLIVYGSVFLIIVSVAFFATVSRMDTIEKILVIALTLYAFMENYMVNIVICFPLLLVGKYLYAQRRKPSGRSVAPKEEIVPLWKRKSV